MGGIVVLALLFSLLLFSKKIQNKVLRSLTSDITEKIDGRVEFGSVRVVPFNTAVITDAVILDNSPFAPGNDTLGYIGKLKASFTLRSLLSKHGVELSRLDIEDGWLNLVIEPSELWKTNLQRVFHLKKKEVLPEEAPDIFRFKRVKIRNFRYTMRDFFNTRYVYGGTGINWLDLDVTADLDIHNMAFSNLIMSGVVDRLDAVEKCGYSLTGCSGDATVGRGNVTVKNLHICDNMSDLDLPLYSMTFQNSRVFSDFLNKVTLEGQFRPSTLAIRSIPYYSGELADNPCIFSIEAGSVKGTVSDFIATGLVFTESTSGVSGDLDCHVSGIPDMANARFNLETRNLNFNMRSLARLVNAFAGPGSFKPGKLAGKENFNLRCKVNGTVNDLSVDALVRSTAGKATTHSSFKNLADKNRTSTVNAYVNAANFNLGSILGIKGIGKVDAVVSGSAELIPDNPRIIVDSLKAGRINLMGHDYHGIYGKGGYGKMGPFGTLIIDDSALKLVASGERMRYTVSVPGVDLHALSLDTRDGVSTASFNAGLNFAKDNCELGIYSLKLTDDEGTHDIGNIRAEGFRDGKTQRINLKSSFANVEAEFKQGVASFLKDIQYATTRRDLDILYNDIPENRAPADCRISVDVTEAGELLSFLLPELRLSGNTAADLTIKSGLLKSEILSENIAWKNISVRNLKLYTDNAGGKINLNLDTGNLNVPGIALDNTSVSAFADDNRFCVTADYCGAMDKDNSGHISVNGNLFRREDDSLAIHAHINDSRIILAGTRWNFRESDIDYSSGELSIDNFSLGNGSQSIEAGGSISRDNRERFSLRFNDVDLGMLNYFLDIPTELGGRVDGGAILISPVKEKLQLALNLHSNSVNLSGIDAGAIMVGSAWDDEKQRLNIMLQNVLDDKKALDIKAWFAPSTKEIDAVATMDKFSVAPAAPLLKDILSYLDGSISGRINCSGPLDSLSVFSDGTRFQDVKIKPAYTGVPYTLNGLFSLNKENVALDSLVISDESKGKATVSGTISNIFRKPLLDVRLSMQGIKVLDVDESSAEGLYGLLAVSGSATASGPLDNLFVDASISNYGGGEIHIPLNSAMTQSQKELLTFVTKETKENQVSEEAGGTRKPGGNIVARAKVRLSPDVTAFAEIDKSSGNLVSAFGNGDVEIDLDMARNVFQINGDYQIRGGSYRFAIPGIIGKDLSISDGSSVKFCGDLMDSQLDINALYSLKTSIAPLTTDTTSVSSRRLVNCILSISDRLRNPSLGFGVEIPDLDPITNAQVQTALNTEDKVQRQFVSLLLLNSFLPSESSGIVNANSNMLYANMAEMMSGQVNSILQKLEIPLDLGFGYQVGDAGTDIFDVAVSTQLFNNRVIVGGSVGNRKYSTTTNANGDVVGDLDIEVKIDRSGQLRFKLFSHSADEFTSFLDYTQRNGIGVTYQREFGRKAKSGPAEQEELKKIAIE